MLASEIECRACRDDGDVRVRLERQMWRCECRTCGKVWSQPLHDGYRPAYAAPVRPVGED